MARARQKEDPSEESGQPAAQGEEASESVSEVDVAAVEAAAQKAHEAMMASEGADSQEAAMRAVEKAAQEAEEAMIAAEKAMSGEGEETEA